MRSGSGGRAPAIRHRRTRSSDDSKSRIEEVRRQRLQRMAGTRLPPQDRSDRGGLGVNVPLIVAGSLAILGAAIHGVGGEVLVVRKLSPGTLPSSRFGGPRATKMMIHVTWHMT